MQTSNFQQWRKQLNIVAIDQIGLPLDELPPFDLEPEFQAGKTPEQCFESLVLPESVFLGYAEQLDGFPPDPSAATDFHDLSTSVTGLTGARLPLNEHLALLNL